MLDSVIRYALRYRFVTLMISLIALVGGSYLATTMPIDVFPDLDRPRVVVLTECPGLATEEVESLVSNPCLLYTSPSPRDATLSRMPSSA